MDQEAAKSSMQAHGTTGLVMLCVSNVYILVQGGQNYFLPLSSIMNKEKRGHFVILDLKFEMCNPFHIFCNMFPGFWFRTPIFHIQ